MRFIREEKPSKEVRWVVLIAGAIAGILGVELGTLSQALASEPPRGRWVVLCKTLDGRGDLFRSCSIHGSNAQDQAYRQCILRSDIPESCVSMGCVRALETEC